MPIKIPKGLPALSTLEMEGVMVMDEQVPAVQSHRPLRIGLLNLMPNKINTETQIARLLGSTPLQVELTLIKTSSDIPIDHACRRIFPRPGRGKKHSSST